ncbi:MAG: alpha-ribazole phosphatase [Anaerolineae bacterium]
MFRLLLVRHGETTWNASGRYQGQRDIPLNEAGRAQAVAVARRLASVALQAIYTSDLGRAAETARVIAQPHGLEVHEDVRLRELNFGVWQGLTYQQIAAQDPKRLARWNTDRANRAPPEGESLAQMAARLRALLDEVKAQHPNDTVALISHGGTIRVILCLLLDHPLSAYWQFEVDNTAVAEIEWRSLGPVVVRWNDAHHLTESNRLSVF